MNRVLDAYLGLVEGTCEGFSCGFRPVGLSGFAVQPFGSVEGYLQRGPGVGLGFRVWGLGFRV